MDTDEQDSRAILKNKLNNFWRHTGYVMNTARANRIRTYLKEAESHLNEGRITDGFDAFYQAKREHRRARQAGELFYPRSWQGMIFAVSVLAVGILGLLVVWNFRNALPGIFLPLLSVLGGGVGGAAAVLIRAMDVDPDSEVVSHFTWYVIKTTVGAALGLITYFALVAGLNLFSDTADITKPEGAIVVGFLAGFFETFSTGILSRLAGQFTRSEGDSKPEPQAGKDPD